MAISLLVFVGIILQLCFYGQTTLIVANKNDDGIGSKRDIVQSASSGDTIRFELYIDEILLSTGEKDQEPNWVDKY